MKSHNARSGIENWLDDRFDGMGKNRAIQELIHVLTQGDSCTKSLNEPG